MMVRRAIAAGVAPIEAIRMATLNVAEWFRLDHLGAIGAGASGEPDRLRRPQRADAAQRVRTWRLVAKGGAMLPDVELPDAPDVALVPLGQCEVDFSKFDLRVAARGDRIRVIGARPDQLVTDALVVPAKVNDGEVVADVAGDVLKMIVVGRHAWPTRQGIGLSRVALQRGAIAGTIAMIITISSPSAPTTHR
jgi:adenine deaminase